MISQSQSTSHQSLDTVPVLFIVGPTGIGKTRLSIKLAKRLNGEIVSADSMQVYKGMTILSQAPTAAQRRQARHHLVAILDPGLEYSAAIFPEEGDRSPLWSRSKGKFLVATENVRDPRFMETVILLIKHDRSWSMGLIMNRPLEVKLHEIFPGEEELQNRNDPVHFGGPVNLERALILLRSVRDHTRNRLTSSAVFITVTVSTS